MRKLFTLFLLGTIGLLGSPAAWADHLSANLTLSARLTTTQEVPAIPATAAQGTASFIFNPTRDTLFINATFSGLSGPIVMAHIHKGIFGEAGPVITPLTAMVRGNQLRGYLTGADISQDRIADYLTGNNYINVHTAAHPDGEIRGQIFLETDDEFVAQPTSDQEVPTPPAPNPNASGFGVFSLGRSATTLKFRVVLNGLSGPVTKVHFHNGAFGKPGPVVIDLMPFLSGNVVEGELSMAQLTRGFLDSLYTNRIYFNVHTDANPDGEIRGQVFYSGAVDHDARADATQTVPATTSAGKGVVLAQLYPTLDTLDVFFSSTGLSGPVTSVSIYAADAGQANVSGNGGNLLATIVPPAGQTVIPDVYGRRFILPLAAVNAALTGLLNVTFNTAANPNGEIRGQLYRLAREGYTFSLNGAQERPTPTPSTGYGSGFVSIDRDQTNAFYGMTWGGLTGPAIMGHFHTGTSNEAGPIVFALTPSFDTGNPPSYAYGYWTATNPAPNDANPFTLERSMQFQQNGMYVNLHTAQYPNGEIRGQVYRGARNLQRILPTQPAALITETFSTYPSPFQNDLTLTFDARRAGSGSVLVADMLGRTVLTQSVQVRTGANSQQLTLPNAAPGVYLVTVEVDDAKLVSRVFKQ